MDSEMAIMIKDYDFESLELCIANFYQIEYWSVFMKSLRSQQIEYSPNRHCKRYDYNILSLDFSQQ